MSSPLTSYINVNLNPREDIFLTTKLRPTDLGGTRCRYAVSRFLEELNTDYLDLLLIHAPDVPPILSMAPSSTQQVIWKHNSVLPPCETLGQAAR